MKCSWGLPDWCTVFLQFCITCCCLQTLPWWVISGGGAKPALWVGELLEVSISLGWKPHWTPSLSFYFLLSPVLRHVFLQLYSMGASLVAQMVKNPPANAGDPSLIPGWERSSGGGNGNPLQYSCLENPMDRGTWRATVHGLQRVRHDWASNIFSMELCSSHLLPSPPGPLHPPTLSVPQMARSVC